MIRIMLVDDQALVLSNLRMRLQLEPDFQIVGEAIDGTTAIATALELHPDIIVMDVSLPGVDGIEATAQLQQAIPPTAIIILTLFDQKEIRARAATAGARAFVGKHEPDGVLIDAIRRVSAGHP